LINSEEGGGREIQQDDKENGSTNIIADNSSIDKDQKLHNTSSSSYEDNSEEWLMKRARKAFSASAEDEDDWLFKRARLSFAASAEDEEDDENTKHSSDPMEVTPKAYIDEVLAEMEKLERGRSKKKVRYKGVTSTAEVSGNIENKMEQKE
jgi:hypothetical protein